MSPWALTRGCSKAAWWENQCGLGWPVWERMYGRRRNAPVLGLSSLSQWVAVSEYVPTGSKAVAGVCPEEFTQVSI